MQASIERRSHAERVPMDPRVVEITFLDYDETTEADAINLAEGGISLRASLLPDVGSEMRCSLPMPGGAPIEANCEVVWAQHAGPYAGEFGLRFVDLAPADAARIREYVATDATRRGSAIDGPSSSSMDRASNSVDPASIARDEVIARAGAAPHTTLHLDGVPTPIHAEVVHDDGDVLVVEQELPFLRHGMGISEGGSDLRGRLGAVDVRVQDGTPRLVLTVLFGESEFPGAIPAPVDAPLPAVDPAVEADAVAEVSAADEALPPAHAEAAPRPEDPLDTVPDEALDAPSAEPVARTVRVDAPADALPPPVKRVVDVTMQRPSEAYVEADAEPPAEFDVDRAPEAMDAADREALLVPEPAPELADAPPPPARESTQVFRTDDADEADALAADDSPVARLSVATRAKARRLRAQVGPAAERAKALAGEARGRALPLLALLWSKIVLFARTAKARAIPAARAGAARLMDAIARLRGKPTTRRITTSQRPARRQQSRLGPAPGRGDADADARRRGGGPGQPGARQAAHGAALGRGVLARRGDGLRADPRGRRPRGRGGPRVVVFVRRVGPPRLAASARCDPRARGERGRVPLPRAERPGARARAGAGCRP